MESRTVDVAVIGAGSAGLAARREAVRLGASVVLIEGGQYGTTCARVGCMPSKLLIAAADAAHRVAEAGRFGVRVPDGVRVDGPAVLERVRRERDRFVGLVLDSVAAIPAAERLRGQARFASPTTLLVGDHTRVDAKAVVVATGSSPSVPAALRPLREHLLLSDDVFELADLPASLAVVGAGIAGLELGQAMHRLGVRTTVFSRSDALGPFTDPVVHAAARDVLGRELALELNSEPDVTRDAAGFRLRWRAVGGPQREARYDALLCTTGRHPNLEGLELARAGVPALPAVDPHTLQCGDLPIFFAGDVTAYRPTLHEAIDEGRVAGGNAAQFPKICPQARRTPLLIVFTDPNMAMVGASFRELEPDQVEIGCVSYADQGRARAMGENAGMVRIYARREGGTLIGAEMLGPRVEHTAHLLAWAVQRRLTVEDALALPFYHPVIEEGIRTALRDLYARLARIPAERPTDLECGPGA